MSADIHPPLDSDWAWEPFLQKYREINVQLETSSRQLARSGVKR